MSDLKEKKIPKLLPAENICTYAIDWTERGKSLCTQIKYSFVMIVFRKKSTLLLLRTVYQNDSYEVKFTIYHEKPQNTGINTIRNYMYWKYY